MAELNFTARVMGEVLDHIKNSKVVSVEAIKEMYDQWAPTYDEELRKQNYGMPFQSSKILSEYFSDKNISILDCASGTGMGGQELQRLGYTNIVALDMSPNSLAAAEQKGVYKKLVCAEVGKGALPFADKTFDAVACSGCFLPTHLRPKCLPELVRVTKSGGIIVVLIGQKFIEVVEGEEESFCKYYQLEFDEVTQELERSNRWKLISKTNVPYALTDKEILAFVWKVL